VRIDHVTRYMNFIENSVLCTVLYAYLNASQALKRLCKTV